MSATLEALHELRRMAYDEGDPFGPCDLCGAYPRERCADDCPLVSDGAA